MKVHYVIVLIKICPDAGNDLSTIPCNFGSLLVRGFKVISHRGRPPKYPPSPLHPDSRRQKKEPAMNRGLNEFTFLFLSHKMIVSVKMFLNPSQLILLLISLLILL